MKIDCVRIRKVTGTMPVEGTFWEERLVRPVDIYPEYRAEPPGFWGHRAGVGGMELTQCFLEIEAGGLTGIAGPIWPDVARLVLSQLAPLIVGRDGLASEMLWDQMHRIQVHGRQGDPMIAISSVDCALWDLKAKAFAQPIARLLGGPTRAAIPAYASMLGFAVLDPGAVRERALEYQAKGYRAQKWFFRHGPESGHEGMRHNVALVRTLRETLGDEYDIMFDCWQSMRFDYAVELCSRIEEFRPRWLEEPFLPDRIDSHVKLKGKTRIPLSGAEHEYTRWGFRRWTDSGALDILQPDIYWCGGLSETLKITALATAHDLVVIPHGHSSAIGIHFSVAQSPVHTPYLEFLVKWNEVNQFFLAHPVWPEGGDVACPMDPATLMDLDRSRIESEEVEEVRGSAVIAR